MSISVKDAPIGQLFKHTSWHTNGQVVNEIRKVANDRTPLARDIAYFNFTDNRNGKDYEFAIWQWEIDRNFVTLTEIQ